MNERLGAQNIQPIRERISPGAIDALMHNYRDGQQAFLELIDNAVDNRIEGQPLTVRVRVTKNELSVVNQGGRGLDLEGLNDFFVWGYSNKTVHDIGFFGVGGKAAMGYLGRSMEVSCSAKDSNIEYRVEDPMWERRAEGEFKEFIPQVRRDAPDAGTFRVKIGNLKKEINPIALSTKLGDIYRPLLHEGMVSIIVNSTEVKPLDIKYKEDDSDFASQVLKLETRLGDSVILKIGILEGGQKVKPGIRCYYKGRLVEDGEFFGHPTPSQLPQASRLIGEAFLDFVPITANKANFDEGSPQWIDASRRINAAMQPWVEKLSKLRIERASTVEAWEKDMARRAKRMLENILAETSLVTKNDVSGDSSGRMPPTPREKEGTPTGKTHRTGERGGATPPRREAVKGIDKVKRWGALSGWEIVAMGNSVTRSDVVEENGKKILKINSDFPMYQAEKGAGQEALELYMGETAILKVAEEATKDLSTKDFLELSDSLVSEWGAAYQYRIKDQRR